MISWLVEQSVLVSALIVVILLLANPVKRYLGANTLYMLWAAIPFSLLVSNVGAMLPVISSTKLPFVHVVTETKQFVAGAAESVWLNSNVLLGVWTLGFATLLILVLVAHRYYLRSLNLTLPNAKQVNEVKSFANSTNVRVLSSQKAQSPFVSGLFTATLVLPERFTRNVPDQHRHLVIQHELVHIRRGDLIFNAIAQLLVLAFWFNPLMWLAYKKFRLHQELACDQYVVATLNKSERLAYANAMLNCSHTASNALQASFINYGEKNMLKQRLTNLKLHQRAKLWKTGLAIALVAPVILAVNTVSASYNKSVSVVSVEEPIYPKQASLKGVTGYVVLQFDILPDGTTDNISVIDSKPAKVFDESAKRALSNWTYYASGNRINNQQIQMEFTLPPPPPPAPPKPTSPVHLVIEG